MEIKIKIFLGQERFQWSGGDANQLFIFIWPYMYAMFIYIHFQESQKN